MEDTLRRLVAEAEELGSPTVTSSSEERDWYPPDYQ
jgi:hypothetical protein